MLALRPQIEAMHAVYEALATVRIAEGLRFAGGRPSPDLRAADAAQEAAAGAWADMRDEVAAMPAQTFDGLRFKAIVGEQGCGKDLDLMRSIEADLPAMTGLAA